MVLRNQLLEAMNLYEHALDEAYEWAERQGGPPKVWGLIANLEGAGFSTRLHKVWMQMELALPLFLMGMVLVGAGFTMRHTRFGKTGLMVLMALMLGLALYFIRNFAQILGENGQIPVAMAAWTPPVAGILASLALLLHLEDG